MNKKILLIILTLTLLIMSGCIHVDMHQKLKRNGNVDLTITYNAPQMILETLSEGIKPGAEDLKNVEIKQTKDSFSLTIKNVNEEILQQVFEDEDESMNEDILNQENFNIERRFSFPYYYFTYTMDLTNEANLESEGLDELEDMLGDMLEFTFTVEVFGRITETNGEKLSKNEARFNIVDTSEAYSVEFRDFFLFTWIGSLF